MNIGFSRAQSWAFLFLVILIISYNAIKIGELDGVRFTLHDVAARPEKAADLRAQYDNMRVNFGSGADTYTYYFMSSPIAITKSESGWKHEDAVIEMVVDRYAFQLYYSDLINGPTGYVFSSSASFFFRLVAGISYVLSIWFMLKIYADSGANALRNKLKTMGVTLAAAGVCAFVLLLALLMLAGQVFNGPIAASGFGSVWNTVEMSVISALIQNTLAGLVPLVMVLGIIILITRRQPVTA